MIPTNSVKGQYFRCKVWVFYSIIRRSYSHHFSFIATRTLGSLFFARNYEGISSFINVNNYRTLGTTVLIKEGENRVRKTDCVTI